jgi:peptidoglycan/LPS O-acetylase OafA/YrhL
MTTRLPGLDGLRAISIGLVVFGHLAGTRGFPLPAHPFFASMAMLGVRVFFVISGFLITRLLLSEQAETGRIDLGRFYFRRTLRIFVPYYAFLLVLLLCDPIGSLGLAPGDLATAATYTSNYRPHLAWPVGHTWSLAVEEQFYLAWPALLLVLGRRRGLWLAVLVILLTPVVRIGLWQLAPSARATIGHRFETVADALATGCLLAGLFRAVETNGRLAAIFRSRAFALVPLGAVALTVLDSHPRLAFSFGASCQNLAIALCLGFCLHCPERPLPRLLASPPLVQLGVMSYSVYLWQQPLLNRSSLAPWCAFPLNLVALAVMATLSYYAVERVALSLRQRLETGSDVAARILPGA